MTSLPRKDVKKKNYLSSVALWVSLVLATPEVGQPASERLISNTQVKGKKVERGLKPPE